VSQPPDRRAQFKIWFHRGRALIWVVLTLAALRWWPTSVAFVMIMSGYANVVSDWTAGEAADDRDILERLQRIEELLRADVDGRP
jgi:hypothetical protein